VKLNVQLTLLIYIFYVWLQIVYTRRTVTYPPTYIWNAMMTPDIVMMVAVSVTDLSPWVSHVNKFSRT